MIKAYSEETAHAINGVPGRLMARHVRPDRPDLFSAQKWISEARAISGYSVPALIRAEIRFDDNCKNGRANFAITGEVRRKDGRGPDNGYLAGGCNHDDIAKAFPELAHLIKWHLCATDGPWGYIGNTVYLAGDRDHNGLLKGEQRQIINGRTKLPAWQLEALQADGMAVSDTPTGREYIGKPTIPLFLLTNSFDAASEAELPPVPELRWVPWMKTGEGKERDLDAARRTAVWPNATDAELCADKAELTAKLEARLPMLIAQFRGEMNAAGLLWAPEPAEQGAIDVQA